MDTITINAPFKHFVAPEPTLESPIVIEVEKLSQVSDGYHTIAELYDHRITLFIALCRYVEHLDYPFRLSGQKARRVWRSKMHSDGKLSYDGWFIIGIGSEKGKQISYHIPLSYWDETDFTMTLDRAPEWDGHTSADVLNRLKTL